VLTFIKLLSVKDGLFKFIFKTLTKKALNLLTVIVVLIDSRLVESILKNLLITSLIVKYSGPFRALAKGEYTQVPLLP
jgi:hypothetical protein